jgi:hypothetical protein
LSQLRRSSCNAVFAWVTLRRENSLVVAMFSIWDVLEVG